MGSPLVRGRIGTSNGSATSDFWASPGSRRAPRKMSRRIRRGRDEGASRDRELAAAQGKRLNAERVRPEGGRSGETGWLALFRVIFAEAKVVRCMIVLPHLLLREIDRLAHAGFIYRVKHGRLLGD